MDALRSMFFFWVFLGMFTDQEERKGVHLQPNETKGKERGEDITET